MKKLISLGGNYFQMTAVKAAKRLGYYVIDVDYLPQNPAHKYADEYYNISTLDREAVLELAKEKKIDGIISYASDVSAPTAAWVAEKLGLPTNPYETVRLMTRKDMFHPFLKKNGFYVPENIQVTTEEQVHEFFKRTKGDIMLKPVNSAGSKGVSRISKEEQIKPAFEEAVKYARGEALAAEEFIHRKGYQADGDLFVINGKIVFWGVGDQHCNNNCNPFVPAGISFPQDLTETKIEEVKQEIQRAITLLNFETGAINLEYMLDLDGNLFIIEMGPRSGGNLIPDAIKFSSGIDLAEYVVKSAVGDDISDLRQGNWDRYISSCIWHSVKSGVFDSMYISNELKKKIVLSDLFVLQGDNIHKFINGGYGIGAALIEYDSKSEMLEMMDNINEYYKVNLI